MIQFKKTFSNLYVFLFLWMIFSNLVFGQNTWIYGIHTDGENFPAYLVRLNYVTGEYDSLLYINTQCIDNYGVCIDPYNGRYFLTGMLESYSNGNLHCIDLNTLEITSYFITESSRKQIEYNSLNNSIIYKTENTFRKFDLNSEEDIELDSLVPITGWYFSKNRYYNPRDNVYVDISFHNNSKHMDFVVADAFTGEQLSFIPAKHVLYSLVVDYNSGKRYAILDGTICEFNPYNDSIFNLLTIPDWYGQFVGQQSVYDQINKKYIVFYCTNNYKNQIAVIDMINYTIDTIYELPDDKMYCQEIYSKPNPQLSLINDTLYTTYGMEYNWYLNGELIPSINTQKFTPTEQGYYQTYVTFFEYSNLSNSLYYSYENIDVNENLKSINFYPNPFNEIVYLPKDMNAKIGQLNIINSKGNVVLNCPINNLHFLNLKFLPPDYYLFTITDKENPILKRKMIKYK